MALLLSGLESIVSFVGFHISGLLQNRGVASTSYMLRVRVTSSEHFAETLNCSSSPCVDGWHQIHCVKFCVV